jgi:hypothetical protein
LIYKLLEAVGCGRLCFEHFASTVDGLGETALVEGFQDIINGADVEGLNRVLIEGRGEDHVGHFHFALDQLFQDTETVETGHFYVKKNQIGEMFLDQSDGFDAIFSLTDEVNFGETLQQESELIASRLFVIDDDGVDGHVGEVTATNLDLKRRTRPVMKLR